jgi:hypothetical protein
MDWKPGSQASAVSAVSSLPARVGVNSTEQIRKKDSFNDMPGARAREKGTDAGSQRTDTTDTTQKLDGKTVTRIIWETDNAVIFADEHGRFWRYLSVYQKAWPVIMEGGK